MSYDVSIGDFEGNYSWNNSSFFFMMLPKKHKGNSGILSLNGMTGAKAAELLDKTLEDFSLKIACSGARSIHSQFDTGNSQDSLIGCVTFLSLIMAACYRNPDLIIEAT